MRAVVWTIGPMLTGMLLAADVTITVDTTPWDFSISDRLVGLHQVYGNVPDSVYADGSIAAWARRAGISTSRFPGGTVVKYWDWENPSGQVWIDNYAWGFDPANNAPASQWMGLDEYLDFVNASGIHPHFGVNTASAAADAGGDYPLITESDCIARAVRMVQYVKARGHGGAWWYLGNEEAHWHGGMAAYARVCARYAQAMKAVDPDIKLFWNDNGADAARVKEFLNNDGGWMDGLETHQKWPYGGTGDYGVKTLSHWQNDLPMQDYRYGVKWRWYAKNTYRQAAADVGRSILVANNEMGIGKDENYTGFNRYTKGLMLTEFLMEMFIGNWDMSCFWDMNVGTERGLLDAENGYRFNPFHLGMDMLADAQGGGFSDILPTWTQRKAEPTLHGFAARKGSHRLVYLLNKGNSARSLQLNLSDASYPAAWARRMQNSADGYGEMVPVQVSGSGTAFTANLPAFTFTEFVFGPSPLPVVNNGDGADAVGNGSATLNGNLEGFRFSTPEVTVYWGHADGGTDPAGWDHAVPLGLRDIGPLTASVTGHPPAQCYYRFYAANDFGEAWAQTSTSFSLTNAPTIRPPDAPPTSLAADALEDPATMFWIEEQTVTLPADITVDRLYPSGQTIGPSAMSSNCLLRSGARVTSYLVHLDSQHSTTLTGSYTLSNTVFAVIFTKENLDATDGALGLPGIAYPSGVPRSGLDESGDILTLSQDGRSIDLTLQVETSPYLDQIRLLTLHPEVMEAPTLGLRAGEGSALDLMLSGQYGYYYTLQFSTNLLTESWMDLQGWIRLPGEPDLFLSVPMGTDLRRYLRVVGEQE